MDPFGIFLLSDSRVLPQNLDKRVSLTRRWIDFVRLRTMPTTESSDSTAAASLPALSPTLCDSKRRWRHLWQTHTDWPSIVCIGTSGPKIYDLRKFERGSVQARNLMLFSNHCIRRKATCRNFLMFESFFDYHDRSFYTKSEHATVTLREICLPNPFILHTMNEDDCASILRQVGIYCLIIH